MLCSVVWADVLPDKYMSVYYVTAGVYVGSNKDLIHLIVDGTEYYTHVDERWPSTITPPKLEFHRDEQIYGFAQRDGDIVLFCGYYAIARAQLPPGKHPWAYLDILQMDDSHTEFIIWCGMYILGIHIQWD